VTLDHKDISSNYQAALF